MGDTIKYLYNQFIIRDMLSYVTPGAILIWTTIDLFFSDLADRNLAWPYYIVMFGVFYATGFALESLNELVGTRIRREYRSSLRQRINILFTSTWEIRRTSDGKIDEDYDETVFWWTEGFKRDYKFFDKTKKDKEAQQGRERIVVIKVMSGNILVAIICSAIVGFLKLVNSSPWFLLVVALPLCFSLFWGQRITMLRQWCREEILSQEKNELY
jgi:hypothetical protein